MIPIKSGLFAGLLFFFTSFVVAPPDVFSQDDVRNHALLPEITARKSAIEPVLPIYPDEAVQRGIFGVVRIMLEISAQGEVLRIKVKPRTNPLLKAAVVEAVERWKFRPWLGPDGTGEAVITRLAFRFDMTDGEAHAGMYDPLGPSEIDCLGCSNSMLELRLWREWEEVTLDKSSRKP